jgi:hypothetical protein
MERGRFLITVAEGVHRLARSEVIRAEGAPGE